MAQWAYTPSYRGFDTHFGFFNGAIHYWAHTHPESSASSPLDFHRVDKPGVPSAPVTDLNGTATHNTSEYGPFVYAREAVRVIENHKAQNDQRPLFIYLAHQR